MAAAATTATCLVASIKSNRSAGPHCVGLPSLAFSSSVASATSLTAVSKCPKMNRNVSFKATGEAPAEVSVETPEIVKTIQEAWDKIDDKYAVASLAFAGVIALWGATGLISAIDRLPLVPGIFELVGIGYTGWFGYRNLIFKPDREALIEKVKGAYVDITGSS